MKREQDLRILEACEHGGEFCGGPTVVLVAKGDQVRSTQGRAFEEVCAVAKTLGIAMDAHFERRSDGEAFKDGQRIVRRAVVTDH